MKKMFKVTRDTCEAPTNSKNVKIRNTEDLFNYYCTKDSSQETVILTENKDEARAAFEKACAEAEVTEHTSNHLVVFPVIEILKVEIDDDDMETDWETIDEYVPAWSKNKLYKVEYWDEENGLWINLDQLFSVEGEDAQDAIRNAIGWMIENDQRYGDVDCNIIHAEYEAYKWRASQNLVDYCGYLLPGKWETL